jgi:hypothetical protein
LHLAGYTVPIYITNKIATQITSTTLSTTSNLRRGLSGGKNTGLLLPSLPSSIRRRRNFISPA